MKIFSLFIALLLLIGTASATDLVPTTNATEYGTYEEFILDMNVNYSENFTGFQYELVYDETMLEVTNVDKGDLLYENGFLGTGEYSVFGTLLYENEFTESGTLNTVQFKTLGKTGYTTIGLDYVILIDKDLNEIPVNVTPCVILIDTAPIVEDIPDKTVTEGGTSSGGSGGVYIDVNVTDPDGDEIKTFWVENKPEGAVVNATDHTFRWDEPVAGTYYIEFLIGDGYLDVTKGFTLTVLPAYLEYDINMDREINIFDLTMVANTFGQTTTGREDVTGDGIVNISDLVLVANNFGLVQDIGGSI